MHFNPLGYPLRQRFWELGGPTHPIFGVMVGLSSVLDKVFLFCDKALQFENTAVRSRLGSKFGPKFGTFCSPVKKGGNMGQMSVDILGVGAGSALLVH